jgi:hypothetical protein
VPQLSAGIQGSSLRGVGMKTKDGVTPVEGGTYYGIRYHRLLPADLQPIMYSFTLGPEYKIEDREIIRGGFAVDVNIRQMYADKNKCWEEYKKEMDNRIEDLKKRRQETYAKFIYETSICDMFQ